MDMRPTVFMLLALLCGCARKFDIVETAKADGLADPISVRFEKLWDFYADHPAAARRMVEGCKTVTIPADDPRRVLCGAALLGLHGHYDGVHGAGIRHIIPIARP